MCRLLGIVSSEPTRFRILLREAQRSLAALSEAHPDGWGIAVYGGASDALREPPPANESPLAIRKEARRASHDENFHAFALGAEGTVLIAHIRKKTVGAASLHNTHPFRRGRYVFAHNGTIKQTAHLRLSTSRERLAEIEGDTDSELLFAHLLSRLDQEISAGASDELRRSRTDETIARVSRDLRDRADFGSFNFLFSDGDVTYAHRCGRSLFLLMRQPHHVAREHRTSEDGTIVQTPWSQRRHAVFIASEQLTDEPWMEIDEGALVRIDRLPQPSWRIL